MSAVVAMPSAARRSDIGSAVGTFATALWRLLWPILVAVAVVVACWVGFLSLYDVNPAIGKTPADVWSYLFTRSDAATNRGTVFSLVGKTLTDSMLGYVPGVIAALLFGIAFVAFGALEQAFMPIVMLLRAVPLVTMTPLIVLVFGRGAGGVAVIGGIVVFFPALVNIVFGLRAAPRQTTDLVLAYGGNWLTVMMKVALPSALPAIFASLRISVPSALTGALVAEWLATNGGVGGGIQHAIGAFDYGQVWSDIAVLTGASLVIYTVVGVAESVVLTAFGLARRP